MKNLFFMGFGYDPEFMAMEASDTKHSVVVADFGGLIPPPLGSLLQYAGGWSNLRVVDSKGLATAMAVPNKRGNMFSTVTTHHPFHNSDQCCSIPRETSLAITRVNY